LSELTSAIKGDRAMQRVNKFRMKLLKNTLTALANWEDKEN